MLTSVVAALAAPSVQPATLLVSRVEWRVANLTCDICERELSSLEAYCTKQLPRLTDVTLDLYSCGVSASCGVLLDEVRQMAHGDDRCCGIGCACLPTCDGCPAPPPPPTPPPPSPPPKCTPIPPLFVEATMAQLRKFCALHAGPTAPEAVTEAAADDATSVPAAFDSFCERFSPSDPNDAPRCFGACHKPPDMRVARQRALQQCHRLLGELARQHGGDICGAACSGKYVEPCVDTAAAAAADAASEEEIDAEVRALIEATPTPTPTPSPTPGLQLAPASSPTPEPSLVRAYPSPAPLVSLEQQQQAAGTAATRAATRAAHTSPAPLDLLEEAAPDILWYLEPHHEPTSRKRPEPWQIARILQALHEERFDGMLRQAAESTHDSAVEA